MAIGLPLTPQPNHAEPRFLDSGGYQKPVLQGEVTRLDRLGDKFALDVNMPPMKWNKNGTARIWVSRLIRGRSLRVFMPFPQPGFTPPGNDAATAAVGSNTGAVGVDIQGLPGVTVLEGQFVSHLQVGTGRRYLYQVSQDANMGVDGRALVRFWPRLRGTVAVGDIFEFANPKIEGYPGGDTQSWTLELALTVGLAFTVEEAG